MSSDHAPLRTPLHSEHVAAGGRMVAFAGWEMPVQYTGVIDEHMAVRTRAGLFDVSHMGEARVRGREALDFLQHVTCNNVARLVPGRAHYNALTLPNGAFADDLLIYMLDVDDYLLVLNAANTEKDLGWLRENVCDRDVSVEDASSEWAQIAVQGPESQAILQSFVQDHLAAIRYYGFVRADFEGASCVVSRTGYTGEDGFEIYSPPEIARSLWRELVEAGSGRGLVPVGLGARDTLRLEAKMALYGNDIDDTTTVLEADLAWIVKLKKGDFIGRDALADQKRRGLARKLVGFEMVGRVIGRHGYPATKDGKVVGEVTSGTRAPFLGKSIGLVYLPPELWEPGSSFDVEIRGRSEPAVVVPTPFYKRTQV